MGVTFARSGAWLSGISIWNSQIDATIKATVLASPFWKLKPGCTACSQNCQFVIWSWTTWIHFHFNSIWFFEIFFDSIIQNWSYSDIVHSFHQRLKMISKKIFSSAFWNQLFFNAFLQVQTPLDPYLDFVLIFASNKLTVNGCFHGQVENTLTKNLFCLCHDLHVIFNERLIAE